MLALLNLGYLLVAISTLYREKSAAKFKNLLETLLNIYFTIAKVNLWLKKSLISTFPRQRQFLQILALASI